MEAITRMMRIDFISLISSSANRKLVERVHACGKEVHVWTVNKKSELERMKMIGVDNIITDRPILAREVILGEENAENLLAAAEGAAAVKKDYRKNKKSGEKHEICTTESQTRECKGRRRAESARSGRGYMVLMGVSDTDTEEITDKMVDKMCKLRIFEDENGKTNCSLADVDGEILLISQFTLYADCSHGNRPGFTGAGNPELANHLYEHALARCAGQVRKVEHGIFGGRYEGRAFKRWTIYDSAG